MEEVLKSDFANCFSLVHLVLNRLSQIFISYMEVCGCITAYHEQAVCGHGTAETLLA